MSKKYFLVTEEWMKWAFTHGAEYAVTADCPPNYPEELDPAGRWLTREQVERVLDLAETDWGAGEILMNELFGPEDSK